MARCWEPALPPHHWSALRHPFPPPGPRRGLGRPIILVFIAAASCIFFCTLEKLIWRTQGPGRTWTRCLGEQRGWRAVGNSPRTQRQRGVWAQALYMPTTPSINQKVCGQSNSPSSLFTETMSIGKLPCKSYQNKVPFKLLGFFPIWSIPPTQPRRTEMIKTIPSWSDFQEIAKEKLSQYGPRWPCRATFPVTQIHLAVLLS